MLTSSAVTGVFHSLSCGLAPERSRPFSPGLTGLLALGATLTLRELGEPAEPAESAENLPNYRNPAGASGAASSKNQSVSAKPKCNCDFLVAGHPQRPSVRV